MGEKGIPLEPERAGDPPAWSSAPRSLRVSALQADGRGFSSIEHVRIRTGSYWRAMLVVLILWEQQQRAAALAMGSGSRDWVGAEGQGLH